LSESFWEEEESLDLKKVLKNFTGMPSRPDASLFFINSIFDKLAKISCFERNRVVICRFY